MEQTTLVYRVENPKKGEGLWRDFDGNLNPVFDKLSEGLCRNLPMPDNKAVYHADGKNWFASAPTKETLKHWFSRKDVEELVALGYGVFEFEVKNTRFVSDFETIFTRDNIVNVNELTISDIWG